MADEQVTRTALITGTGEEKPEIRKHPAYEQYTAEEARVWATYIATRSLLAPYLVPHRFEGDTAPHKLRRAGYGYGFSLNRSWVQELAGHIRGAEATYMWAALMDGESEEMTTRPEGGIAQMLWDDATLDGTTLSNFFGRTVLNRLAGSVGGFVLVDTPDADTRTRRDEMETGKRPFFRFVPWSDVVDFGRGGFGFGYRWIELLESKDTRTPENRGEEPEVGTLLYQLTDNGRVMATRKDANGDTVGEPKDLGSIKDPQGFPVLPLVPVTYGKHPVFPWLGAGLLLGLDDVVIDLFNRLSETTEAFRDAAFAVFWHVGPNDKSVQQHFKDGSRLIHGGSAADGETVSLERLGGDAQEVAAGMQLIELGVKAWAMAAGRKVADAMERAEAQSGVSLKAEFQLDSRPLLTELTETLDEIETNALWVAAQMAGATPAEANPIGVERDTTFQLEDEASRIARITGEWLDALPLPAPVATAAMTKWAEASGLVDMSDPEVQRQVERAAERLSAAIQDERINRTQFLGLPNINPEREVDNELEDAA